MNERELNAMHKELVSLFAEVFAVTAKALEKLAEFDAKQAYAHEAFQSTAHWLNFNVGMSMGAAREHVRVANALAELPVLKQAFSKGTLSFSKLRALVRIATPESEAELLTVANEVTASQLEKIVRGCRKVTLEEAKKQAQSRSVSFGFDNDGMFFLHARLMPDEGARLMAMLEANTPKDEREIGERQADALMSLGQKEEKTEVIVHVEADACQVETPKGEPIGVAAETARRLACDASIVTMVHDKDGNVLDIGRRSRKIPAGMRRALAHRDQGCRYPGCPNQRTDAHHIEHWGDGGETKLSNLICLCKYHHMRLHEGGFGVAVDKNGTATFINAEGNKLCRSSPLPEAKPTPHDTTPWHGTGWWTKNLDYSYITSTLVPKLKK